MFTKLEIKNFKSIGHVNLDLGKINVITGPSNLGKSNVVQAIYCLTHNHWDSNYVKWGEKGCSIKLTADNGEWVEYRHGKDSSAEYRLSTVEVPFTKIGRDVPGPVKDFLNMNMVQFDEDLSLDFNFERQFDPSFVVSLSGFELAKVFGKIMNLDIVLSASRLINKDLAGIKKDIENQQAIENVSIDYIQQNYFVELKYSLLHHAIKLESAADEIELQANQLLGVLTDLEYYKEQVKVYSEFLASDQAKQIDKISEPVQGLDNILIGLEMAQGAQEQYQRMLSKEIPEFDFERLNELVNVIYDSVLCIEHKERSQQVLEKIDQVHFNVVESLEQIAGVLGNLEQTAQLRQQIITMSGNVESQLSNKINEFDNFLKENNICPISGKPFEAGCVENILGDY